MGYYLTSTSSGIVLSDPTAQTPATLASGDYITNTTTGRSGDAVFGTSAAGHGVGTAPPVLGAANGRLPALPPTQREGIGRR